MIACMRAEIPIPIRTRRTGRNTIFPSKKINQKSDNRCTGKGSQRKPLDADGQGIIFITEKGKKPYYCRACSSCNPDDIRGCKRIPYHPLQNAPEMASDMPASKAMIMRGSLKDWTTSCSSSVPPPKNTLRTVHGLIFMSPRPVLIMKISAVTDK